MNAGPGPMVPEPVRVVSARRESEDVVTLTLDLADRPRPFHPGQFNMLYAFGVGEVAISMSGDPDRAAVAVHTIRALGAVTRALSRLGPDGFLGLRGPFGAPWPLELARGKDLLLVAGGLGLAPLRPAVYQVISRRADYRRVWLLAGARAPGGLLFQAEMESWQRTHDIMVLATVDHALSGWVGRVGVVPALLSEVDIDADATVAFVCGPEVMMRFAVRELNRRGLGDRHIYLSLERNMKCAVGLCGHCQLGPSFVCKDGPVFRHDQVRTLLRLPEV